MPVRDLSDMTIDAPMHCILKAMHGRRRLAQGRLTSEDTAGFASM